MKEPRKTPRPMVAVESLFLALGDHPHGHRLFVRRRRRRGLRGMCVGPASEREIAFVKEHLPEIAKAIRL